MSLSTEKYGFIIDPFFSFMDEKGNPIKNGFLRVFIAGSSTPAVTYLNWAGAMNQETIQLDNSGRCYTRVIGAKGTLYKVVVYNILHSQENPLLTVDNVQVISSAADVLDGSVTTPKIADEAVTAAKLHENAVTTLKIADEAVTENKLNNELKLKAIKDYVTPEMFGAVGDGVEDDTQAFQSAINSGKVVLAKNTYKTTSTIYLNGGKSLLVLGGIVYTGNAEAFVLFNNYNSILGESGSYIIGENASTLIKVQNFDAEGTFVQTYYNFIENLRFRKALVGIHLFNNETDGKASYFNKVTNCTFTGCQDGIVLEGYADANFIRDCTFYECGKANDPMHAAVVLREYNNKFPLENHISAIFLDHSTDCTTISIQGRSQYNIFSDITSEPGGTNSRGIYCSSPTDVKYCFFEIIDVSNLGSNVYGGSNIIKKWNGFNIPDLIFRKAHSSKYYEYCMRISKSMGEASWCPLLNVVMYGSALLRVAVDILYNNNGTYVDNQFDSTLQTNVVCKNGVKSVTNSTDFKIENNVLYVSTPRTIIYGTNIFTGAYCNVRFLTYNDFGLGQTCNATPTSEWVVE